MKCRPNEEILHEIRPEPELLRYWFITKSVPFSFTIGIFIFQFGFVAGVFLAPQETLNRFTFSAAAATCALSWLFGLSLCHWYFCQLKKTYVYYITTERCVFHGGIIKLIERSVPYHKITDVEQSRNILERLFGIGNLNIYTPGTASMAFSPFTWQSSELAFAGIKDLEEPAETIQGILADLKTTGE